MQASFESWGPLTVVASGQLPGLSPSRVHPALRPGPYRIVLELPGFRRLERTVAVVPGEITEAEFVMEPA